MSPADFHKTFHATITIAGAPVAGGHAAYKMDDHERKDMRRHAGLGECDCCDYFRLNDDAIMLIEETRLRERAESIKRNYRVTVEAEDAGVVDRLLRDKMRQKVYGAMLVLCRLSCEHGMSRDKQYRFWLVDSGGEAGDDERFYDDQAAGLRRDLRQVFGKKVLLEVKALPAQHLPDKLAEMSPPHKVGGG